MKFVAAMAALAALSTPAALLADAPAAPAQTAATPAPAKVADRDKLICKVQEETGSLIAKKKVCMTAADWRQKQFNSGQWLDHQTATHNGGPGG